MALYEGDNGSKRPGPQPWGEGTTAISWDRPLAIQMGAAIKIDEPVARLTEKPLTAIVRTLHCFSCPADPRYAKGGRSVPLSPGSFADGMAPGTGLCRSYVLNLGSGKPLADEEDGVLGNASAIPFAKVESGSGTVSLIESHGYATVFGQANIANDTTITCSRDGVVDPVDAFTNPQARMHGVKSKPRVNVLMYDGHVEVLEQSSIIANGGQVMQYKKTGVAP